MTLLPDDISDRGYDAVLGYLWMMGKRTGQDGRQGFSMTSCAASMSMANIPSFILRFGYNQLQGMAEGGLFLWQRRRGAFDKLMLQRAMRVHTTRWWS